MAEPFRLSWQACARRRARDLRDGCQEHIEAACSEDHEGLCYECAQDQLAEMADYADQRRQPRPGESCQDYFREVLPGCLREGWLTLASYVEGSPDAARVVEEARANRRRCNCGHDAASSICVGKGAPAPESVPTCAHCGLQVWMDADWQRLAGMEGA